ncbi:endolytic transglycosylase MltG [bacterium]|nr:endolytic transglycosylase MltG [bacterium]
MKKVLIGLLVVIVLLAIGGEVFYLYFQKLNKPCNDSNEGVSVVFEVKPGDTARKLGETLESQHLIRSAKVFEFWARYTDKGKDIKTGFFRINSAMEPKEILETFVSGQPATIKVTFPEGLTLDKCADIALESKICTYREFMRLTESGGKKYGKIFPDNLEGYFLPDTYTLPWKCDGEQLVKIATDRFQELVLPCLDKDSPLSLADTIILASLIEREAQVPEERSIIAGVYLNRLRDGMKLECDATVQYALGEQKEYLLYKDLEIDSPYNTYKITGLPVGPICNPGLASIKAAAHPAKTDYYYYVRNDIKGDGSHVFGRNYSEHQRNIEQYQR